MTDSPSATGDADYKLLKRSVKIVLDEKLPKFPDLIAVEVGPEGAVCSRDRQLGGGSLS